MRLAAVKVWGAEPSPQLTTTEPPPAVKSATVARLVGVGEGPEQDGAGESRCPRCR